MYTNETGLVSVTTVISPYINPEFFTTESAERGSAVHSAISAYLSSVYVIPLKHSWNLYFKSFVKWHSQNIEKVYFVENRLISGSLIKYCGKPDAILKLKNDQGVYLVDWKTSQAYQKWWAIQGAAYIKLAKDAGYKITGGMSVRLKKDGSGCLVDRWPEDSTYDYNIFLSLYNAYKFFNGEI